MRDPTVTAAADPAYATDDDAAERVRVIVTSGEMAGIELAFWQACDVGRALNECAGTASVSVGRGKLRDAGYERFPLEIGNGVQVLIGDDPVLTGWVEKRNTTRKPEEHGLNIQIRSVTGDLVDCSAVNSPGQWRNARMSRIADDLVAAFRIPVLVPEQYDRTIRNFEIEQGETVFDALERLAHMAGLVVHDSAAGVLMMTRPGLTRAETALLHLNGPDGGPDPRNNVLESDGERDGSKRFSHYTVKGQTEGAGGEGGKWDSVADETAPASAARRVGASGSARDYAVGRWRPKIISPPSSASSAACQSLAQWEAARRAGEAERLVLGVRGWRQAKGKGKPLWDIGLRAPVQDDDAEVYGDRLISSVRWTLNDKGRLAVVTLQPDAAFQPKPFIDEGTGEGGGDKWASVRKAVNAKKEAS